MTVPGQQPTWEKRANHTMSSWRAAGGKLRVVGDTLWFAPGGVDRALAAGDFAVRLADVAAFEVEPVNPGHFFGGGLRKRLAVVLPDGRRELFVVSKPEQAADELRALAAGSYS